ncbi:MAG TPA: AEC family transporter [Armatimonadota bacterium]|nr:AEC family transporter [Armatimonadota bacterium]
MPDSKWLIVLVNIAAMFAVILIGWLARRRGYLTEETTSSLSKFVVDIAIPAMVLTGMLRTIDPTKMTDNWFLPLVGASVLIIGQIVGTMVMPFFSRKDQRPTFVFLVAIANWVYLPLPIAQALYGGEGVRAVLLFNVGAQVVLWTMGIWTLRRGKPDWRSIQNLITNPGLVATIIGILLALYVPASRSIETADIASLSAIGMTCKMLVLALVIVGNLTIPLSLIVTGAQLGGLDISDHKPSLTLSGVVLARLFLAPTAVVVLIWALHFYGIQLQEIPRMVAYIIACMPVAVSCSMFTESFGGDTSLAARAIFYSTFLSIVTVPGLFYAIQRMGL